MRRFVAVLSAASEGLAYLPSRTFGAADLASAFDVVRASGSAAAADSGTTPWVESDDLGLGPEPTVRDVGRAVEAIGYGPADRGPIGTAQDADGRVWAIFAHPEDESESEHRMRGLVRRIARNMLAAEDAMDRIRDDLTW